MTLPVTVVARIPSCRSIRPPPGHCSISTNFCRLSRRLSNGFQDWLNLITRNSRWLSSLSVLIKCQNLCPQSGTAGPTGTARPWELGGLLWFRLNHHLLLLTRNKRVCWNSSKWTNNNPQLQIKDSYSQEEELFIPTKPKATESSKLIHWARLLIYCKAPFTPEVWWKQKLEKDSCLLSQDYFFAHWQMRRTKVAKWSECWGVVVAVIGTFATMRVWSREGG